MSYFTLRILARDPAFAHVNRPGPKAFVEIIASEEPCDPCIESKQTLLPFGHSDSEAPAKMTDVCFDLTGQFEGNKEYSRHVIFDESRLYDARFTLDQKQEHPGAASDVVELTVPRRTIKLSDVPFELDPAPIGTPTLEMLDEEDESAWDTTVDNAISSEQQRGDSEDNWPSLDSIFGDEYETEDLATNDWTGELKRHRSPEQMGPSVYGTRNSYPDLDDLGSPINLDDLDNVFQHTPTRTTIEPTVGAVIEAVPQHRRSKRLQEPRAKDGGTG
ncbi:unnamed protein product [Tilletia controversa]|nr:unnamed protein product [Tilletia controversa]